MHEVFDDLTTLFPVNSQLNDIFFYFIPAEIKAQASTANPYSFKGIDSDILLVTVGDSWTWGSEVAGYHDFINFQPMHWRIDQEQLTNINPDRTNRVFGNIVSSAINADWLNLGIPGAGNIQIAENIQRLAEAIPRLSYKRIIIIATFTEIGRWFNSESDTDIDHAGIMSKVRQTNNPEQLLVELNRIAIQKITQSLENLSNVKLLVGTNFVDQIGFENLSNDQKLITPWYKLLGINYPKPVYSASQLTWPNFIRSVDDGLIPSDMRSIFKSWILDISTQGTDALSKLSDSTLISNGKLAAHHPIKQGHEIWADYILKHLK